MGVVQNSIDIQNIIEAGGDPTIAAKVQELEAEIGDENSGIIKDIDDLQEANALIMTSVSAVKTTADSAKARADQAVLWSERKGYVGKNLLNNYKNSETIGSVLFTKNSDGSVTVSGTASGNAWWALDDPAKLPSLVNGVSYFFKAAISADADAYIVGDDNGADHVYGHDTGDGVTFVYDNNYPLSKVQFGIRSGKTVNGTFYPMIKLSSITDNNYEPYLPTNDELLLTAILKSVTAAAADFAAFKTAIAAL